MQKLLVLFLLILEVDAKVNGLDLSYDNNLQNSKVINSQIVQGSLKLYDSVLNNTVIKSRNNIDNTEISNNTLVQQSSIKLINGSALDESEIVFNSLIEKSEIGLNSLVVQNSIYMNDALIDSSLIEGHSVLNDTQVKNSVVIQSHMGLGSGVSVENDSSFFLNNTIDNTSVSKSHLYQGAIVMRDAILNNVEINMENILTSKNGRNMFEDSIVIQGKHMFEGSTIENSRLETKSIISNTTINDATLNLCSTYMYEAMVSNTNIRKHCSMEESKITNGATVYQAMTRFN
ncbi:MAG: Unknown protein [uncultured Sulfurovum sp.]|uniref:Uncharacterized protein n=1 Tax=uncultured Sulfurovum sp. TaxID=269237 RepID=A0A6S6TH42_9BACT|nr:MAG: Unknown protein [uncultured Sulfurovum sp.]